MKKFAALLLVLAMVLAFAGCAMTHDKYMEAAMDSKVTVDTYVQATQSWWNGAIRIYAQSKDGGYFIYDMACTEEEAAKLVPGTKLEIKGFKGEWAGEVEVMDATFKILDGSWLATATDVTALMGTEDLAKHMNELVAFKGAVIAASTDADGNEVPYLYKWDGSGSQGDDIYFNVTIGGATYTFTVESYMVGNEATYAAVEALKIGEIVDLEGFLYWYNGAQPHITSVKVVG